MFERSVGKKPGAVHRLLAHEHRREHRHVAVRGGAVEREAVERDRDERRVADEVAEARAREARGALELEAADLGVLGPVGRRVAPRGGAPTASSSVEPSGAPRVGRVRHRARSALALGLGGGERLLGAAELLLHRRQLLELLRRRLAASSFSRPRSSSTFGTSARQRSSAASSASNGSAAPLRASAARTAPGRRGLRGGRSRSESAGLADGSGDPSYARVEHGLDHLGDALLRRGRADPVGHGLDAVDRVLDRDPVAPPLDELDVVLAVAEGDRFAPARSRDGRTGSRAPSPSIRRRSRTRGRTAATSSPTAGRRTAPASARRARRARPDRRR